MDDLPLPRLSEVAALAAALRGNVAPKAVSFTRLVRCLALSQGTVAAADMISQEHYPRDERLQSVMKAAVAVGSLTNLANLAAYQTLATEFIEASKPSSVLLNLNNARRVPFRTRVARVTASGTPAWVGEGVPKPATALALDSVALEPTKLACIVIVSEELARLSSPSADAVIRADLIASVNAMVDSAFVSSDSATSARPAGILNGVTPVASTGSTPAALAADLGQVAAGMLAAGGKLLAPVLLLNPQTSLMLGLQSSASSPTLPRTIVSAAVPATQAILVDESEVLIADDGEVAISVARSASVMADTAPVVGTTVYHSLWQEDLFATRAERLVNWQAAHAAAAAAGFVDGIA